MHIEIRLQKTATTAEIIITINNAIAFHIIESIFHWKIRNRFSFFLSDTISFNLREGMQIIP